MREIEFRGKRKDNGKWIVGFLTTYYEYLASIRLHHRMKEYVVEPETVGQYTGLKDRNGVKIFEGDILECERHISDTGFKKEKFHHAVNFNNGVFYCLQEFLFNKTIVGNIHDNPEVLDGNKGEEEKQ